MSEKFDAVPRRLNRDPLASCTILHNANSRNPVRRHSPSPGASRSRAGTRTVRSMSTLATRGIMPWRTFSRELKRKRRASPRSKDPDEPTRCAGGRFRTSSRGIPATRMRMASAIRCRWLLDRLPFRNEVQVLDRRKRDLRSEPRIGNPMEGSLVHGSRGRQLFRASHWRCTMSSRNR